MTEGENKNRLKMNFPNKSIEEEYKPYTEEWLKKQILILRDSGDEFKVVSIIESKKGTISKKLVVLKAEGKEITSNKEISELIDNLKTEGSPWKVK